MNDTTGDSDLIEFDPSNPKAVAAEMTRRMVARDQWAEACGRMARDLAVDVYRETLRTGVVADDYSPELENFGITIPRMPLNHERQMRRYDGGSAEVYLRRWLLDASHPRGGRLSRVVVVLCDPVNGYRWEAGGSKRSMSARTPYSELVAAVVADAPTEPDPVSEEEL